MSTEDTDTPLRSGGDERGADAPSRSGGYERFAGRFDHRLDPKRRFTIPLRLYECMGRPQDVYVMRSLKGLACLDVFTPEGFDRRFLRPYKDVPVTDPEITAFLRKLSNAAELLQVDTQNRIRPSDLMQAYAGLETDVVLSAVGDHFEVWSLANYPKADSVEDEQEELMAMARRLKR